MDDKQQPPVDNEHVAPGATPFTDAEVAANAPLEPTPVPVDATVSADAPTAPSVDNTGATPAPDAPAIDPNVNASVEPSAPLEVEPSASLSASGVTPDPNVPAVASDTLPPADLPAGDPVEPVSPPPSNEPTPPTDEELAAASEARHLEDVREAVADLDDALNAVVILLDNVKLIQKHGFADELRQITSLRDYPLNALKAKIA